MNTIIIMGRTGDAPKIKKLEWDTIAELNVAVDHSYKNKQGEKVNDTQWFNVTCRGKLAELAEKYILKGDKILISGKMRSRKYEKDGEKREVWFINAEQLNFIESKKIDQSKSINANIKDLQDEIPW